MSAKSKNAGEKKKREPQTDAAAGMPAVLVTLQHARKQTGITRALRVLSSANQKGGFDCPGCAWPDPAHSSLFEFCENGAKAILDEATTRRVGSQFFCEHSLTDLESRTERWLNDQGRLIEPMILRPGASHYEPLSYEEAFQTIATELHSLKSPDEAAFYTSGRASNEAAFLFQLMARAWGTNNLPDCSNLCHESSGVALKESIGIGKGTVRLSDFEQADLIFVVGQNPGTNHPRMLSALRKAKLNGTAVISINPLIEKGLKKFAHPQEATDLVEGGITIADQFVRVKVNGDQALFRGINKALMAMEPEKQGAVDRSFIHEFTEGFTPFEATVGATNWAQIVDESGIEQGAMEDLARLASKSKRIICCWAMGLTQHHNAVVTIQEVTNFLLLTGNMGRSGAGACPVRGHSNVQGDRTMGIALTLPPDHAHKQESILGIKVPPQPGLDTVATITKMAEGKVKALISLGGNFLSASPDTNFTADALKQCNLTVQISTKLNRSHLVTGKTALILPCLGRTEVDSVHGALQFVSVENSMGVVHSSQGKLPPAHPDLLGEPSIVAGLAHALLPAKNERAQKPHVDWELLGNRYDKIRDLIEEVIVGFKDFNKRITEPGGFELPNGPRERNFTTTSGKAQFISAPLQSIRAQPGELLLMTVRSHDQFNTTIYSDNDRYRGVSGSRKVLLMSPHDLKEYGLKSGQLITITSHFSPLANSDTSNVDGNASSAQTRVLSGMRALSYDVPPHTAVAYFPEANPLVFVESFADRSRTPTSKSIRITVEAATE